MFFLFLGENFLEKLIFHPKICPELFLISVFDPCTVYCKLRAILLILCYCFNIPQIQQTQSH